MIAALPISESSSGPTRTDWLHRVSLASPAHPSPQSTCGSRPSSSTLCLARLRPVHWYLCALAFGAPATSPFGAAAPALGAQMGTDPKGEMLTSVAAGDIYTLAEDGAPPEIGERVLYLRAHRNSYRADRGAHRMRTMQPATVLEVRRPPKSLPVPPSLRMSVPLAPLSPSVRQLRPRA